MCLPNILFPVFMFAFIFHCRSFELFYIAMSVVRTDGRSLDRSLARSLGVRSRDYQIFWNG